MSLERRKRRSLAEAEVERIRSQLPPEIRELAEAVPVHFPGRPDAETAAELGEDLLGLFSGEPYAEIGETLVPIPAQIHLFLDNLWWDAEGDTDRFIEEVRITYLHELGHYLGWDEAEVDARRIG